MRFLPGPLRGGWGLPAVFAAIAVGGLTAWPGEPGGVDPSTREMGRLLAELASKVDPRQMPFQVDDRRAEMLAEDLTWPRPIVERLQLRFSYAYALLSAGKTADCLAAIEALEGGHASRVRRIAGPRTAPWSSC